MYYFTSDYTEGCTPEILEALAATNFEQTGGYGIDPYCETAALLIKKEPYQHARSRRDRTNRP